MATVVMCVMAGVCSGAGIAFVCHKQAFVHVPWLQHMVEVSLASPKTPKQQAIAASSESFLCVCVCVYLLNCT